MLKHKKETLMCHFNLFGEQIQDEIRVKLFCDESKTKDWLYLGLLIVPEKDENELINDLLNRRCANPNPNKIKDWINCKKKCNYHKKNDREVHFTRLGNDKEMYFIAKRWMDYLLSGNNRIRFYVLGIDRTKLNINKFGKSNNEGNIYNRFFRMAVKGVLNSFFNNRKIIITDIYHDDNLSLEKSLSQKGFTINRLDQLLKKLEL